MGFNISKVKAITKNDSIKYGEYTLNFKWKPNEYTPNHEDQVDEARLLNKGGATLKAWLLPLIESWDVMDGIEGEEVVVPINIEGLSRVPIAVLSEIMTKIIEGMAAQGEVKSTTNSEGSFS